MSDQLIELFRSNEFDGKRKIVISSVGTSKRNNLAHYLGSNDVLYAEVLPNPSLRQLVEFFRIVQPTEKDIIVGIGGGSVIDFSKMVALFSETPINEVRSIIESGRYHSIQKALKLVVVPTLFGSGAEHTPFAVCYIEKKKYSVANPLILPARVEYIPEINISAPSKTKLANVLDCFCQAAESITAQNSTAESIKLAQHSLQLLIPIAQTYINSEDFGAAEQMSKSSEFCGKAIAISKTTGPHAMSYYLTSNLNWDHGIAVGFVFIYFLEKYRHYKDSNNRIRLLFEVLSEVLPNQEVDIFFELIGLNINFLSTELINNIDIDIWLQNVNIERLSNGPKVDLSWLNVNDISSYYLDKVLL